MSEGGESISHTPYPQTLRGSFSAVSTPPIARVGAFFSIEMLKNAPTFAIRGVDTEDNGPSNLENVLHNDPATPHHFAEFL